MRNWIMSVNGERLFLKGANHGPTRMALGEATPDELARDVRPRQSTPASTCSACTPTSRGPSSTTPPTRRGCCCGRTCRCSGATPAASASRPSARRARRSTCSATTRRSRSGAGTTSRSPSTSSSRRPWTPKQFALKFAVGQQLPTWNSTILDRSVKSRLRAGRRHPAGDRALGRAPAPAASSTAPTPTSTSAGTTGHERDLPRFCADRAAHGPVRDRVRRPGGARGRRRSCDPEHWPDLDWERPAHGTRCRSDVRQARAARGATRRSKRGGARRRRTRRPS